MNELVFMPLAGGSLIGLAVTLMLLFNGRVTGISGIVNEAFVSRPKDGHWRLAFLAGLILGGLILNFINPGVFENTSGRNLIMLTAAGFLVGFGTVMGGGCTSGHGICGISRLSPRSVIATVIFIFFGILSVTAIRLLQGGTP